MRFAIAFPPWALALLALAVLLLALAAYARPLVPLAPRRRFVLSALRALTLLVAIGCLLRPIRVMPPVDSAGEIVPVLVDVSRSMRLADMGGRTRIDAAADLIRGEIVPGLSRRFHPEVWTFGATLAPATDQPFAATAPRSDMSAALRAVRERYRGRRVAGIVVLSDGGDTGAHDAAATMDASSIPVFTVGVGAPALDDDFEVADVSAGEARLADSSIDLIASAVNHGGGAGFDLRVLKNGQPVDSRHVPPQPPGSPVREVFTVSPDSDAATLYTIEIPSAPGERVTENNRRSLLVEAAGRPRRLLFVEGAPGFEHSFVKRAFAADEGLEIDSVVRKGRDAQGQPTYFVQAPEQRAAQLTSGFPVDRAALFNYDAVVLTNIENDVLSRSQLEMVAAFVAERGGGLLMLGAKSFGSRGLAGTAIEDVLPLGLADRGNGIVRASVEGGTERYHVGVTAEGRAHPVMRIGATADATEQRWSALPALAGAAELGEPRPAAQVLATVQTADGIRPLVAVQRYGEGRSMVFTGEASWRWRMQMPAADRTFELFWRQAARWLSSGAEDPVALAPFPAAVPGEALPLSVDVRDAAFAPVTDARMSMHVTLPGGERRDVRPLLVDARTGRYSAEFTFDVPGVYQVATEARRGDTLLGAAERWMLVGGVDTEMADARLNEEVLRRVSRATGGQYLRADGAARLPSLMMPARDTPGASQVQELWQTWWIFAAIVMLLSAEWMLRRRWGLR